MLLSLLIVFLASCSKNEILPIEEPIATDTEDTPVTPNNIIEILDDKLSTNTNSQDKDALVPTVSYYRNGILVENLVYDIHDPNLWVNLIAKTEMIGGKDRLVYEFHAYDDQEDFFKWGDDNGMYFEEAFNIVQTLASNEGNIRVKDEFLQTGVLSQEYINYMEQVYQNILSQKVPVADILPTSTTPYKDFSNNLMGNIVPHHGTPVFGTGWKSNVSVIDGDNIYFPTILFEGDFFQNRMNPTIWNMSGEPIRFTGRLTGLNDKAESWF